MVKSKLKVEQLPLLNLNQTNLVALMDLTQNGIKYLKNNLRQACFRLVIGHYKKSVIPLSGREAIISLIPKEG